MCYTEFSREHSRPIHDKGGCTTDARKLKDSRYQGWFVGAGVAYGYAWILGRHWNLEAEIGIGYSYTRYDRFRCTGCGREVMVPRHKCEKNIRKIVRESAGSEQ